MAYWHDYFLYDGRLDTFITRDCYNCVFVGKDQWPEYNLTKETFISKIEINRETTSAGIASGETTGIEAAYGKAESKQAACREAEPREAAS